MKTVLKIALLTLVVAGIAGASDPTPVAPEIGAGSAVSAIGLLAGGLFVMRARRKK
jgi:hypothetical protein